MLLVIDPVKLSEAVLHSIKLIWKSICWVPFKCLHVPKVVCLIVESKEGKVALYFRYFGYLKYQIKLGGFILG